MRYNIILVLSLTLLISCKEKDTAGVNPKADAVQGTFDLKEFTLTPIDGSSIQKAVKKDENGHAVEDGYVINGKKTGLWVNYYSDGRVMAIRNFVDGKVDGTYLTIDDRGRVVQQASYKNNFLDGSVSLYKVGSRKMKESYYVNGKREGVEKEYFELGPVQKETSYKNDALDGKMKFYNDKGELIAEYEYKNGVKVSGGAINGATSPQDVPQTAVK